MLKERATKLAIPDSVNQIFLFKVFAQQISTRTNIGKEILRLEKVSLQQQVKQLTLNNVVATRATPENAARIQKLEGERDDLQKRLSLAQTELASVRTNARRSRCAGNPRSASKRRRPAASSRVT